MATRLEPKAIAGVLRQAGLAIDGDHILDLTALALSESGGEVDRVSGTRRGLWLLSDSLGYDRNQMASDAAYAARAAVEVAAGGNNMHAWPTWVDGTFRGFLNAARQAVAQASTVTGTILDDTGQYVPGSFYGGALGSANLPTLAVAPPPAGVGQPITAALTQDAPLSGLRVTGTEMTSDVSTIVIGEPTYAAGMGEIPNLTFTIADPQGDLLWFQRNLWVQGARVNYLDLDLRIDEIKFEPGGHTTGQITITAIDAMVYALQQLRGARVADNVSPSSFIQTEVALAGFDPGAYYLAEQLPTQTQIARDVPDTNSSSSGSDVPSSWTTIQRLAKETGKRAFVSGRKLVFGSAAFAADWAAPGNLRIGWHAAPEGERWLTLPSATQTSIGSKNGLTQVSGRVPLNRALYFRPGVSVIVHNTPSIAAGDRRFVCSDVSFTLSRDVDGAEVTLIEPIDPDPEQKAA